MQALVALVLLVGGILLQNVCEETRALGILYHGSYTEVNQPDTTHSRRNVDFGQEFYTTPLKKQAEKWCKRFQDKGR